MPLMPVAIVEESNNDNIRFVKLPVNHEYLAVDSELVLWNRLEEVQCRFRLVVTELTDREGSARIMEIDLPTNWPVATDPHGYGNPLYIADENETYEPNKNMDLWVKSPRQMDLLEQLANEHLEVANIPPAYAIFTTPAPNNDEMEFPDNF